MGFFSLPNEKTGFCINASKAHQTELKELPCCLPERQHIVSYSDVSPFLPHPSRVSPVSSDHSELEVGRVAADRGIVSVRLSETGGFTALTDVPEFGTIANPESNGKKISKCKSLFCFYTSQMYNGTSGVILES